jgi:hypothetical protein
VAWNSSDESALTYINLGLGSDNPNFNITLHGVYNQTGAGVTCLPNVRAAVLPGINLTEGQNASIQVITLWHTGTSLYNVCSSFLSARPAAHWDEFGAPTP